MNISIRTKFNMGIVFLFVIISVLSIFPALSLNKLSMKTSAILKENHFSVFYARDMSQSILKINEEITNSFLRNKNPDSLLINKELTQFDKSFELEKNNITEAGEKELVAQIETEFSEFCDSVSNFMTSAKPVGKVLNLQTKSDILYQQLMLLSQINGNAIELKTNDARYSAKKALTQMTILGTLCLLVSLSFTFSFASYFSERFFQLYNGIKEIATSNYGQRIYFDGKDEFHEISLVFNEMAEKLNNKKLKNDLPLKVDSENDQNYNDVKELKKVLARLKSIEEEASDLLSRLETKE
jgi:NtrC-family two-component system sensor histidine kinase KinB